MLQNCRARTVAEQHAGVAICPIDDGRKFFRADDQHRFVGARHDELLADFQRVNESRASRFDVECGGALGADLVLNQTGRGRERHVGRDGGHDDQINLLGGDSGLSPSPAGRPRRPRSEVNSFSAAMWRSLMPGAGGDPFVGGIDDLLQVGVGQHLGRNVGADASNGTGAALKIVFGAGIFKFFGSDGLML